MKNAIPFLLFILICFTACIQDDVVDDLVDKRVRITNQVDTLGVDDTFQYTARFTNNLGQVETTTINWFSSDETVLTIDADGWATGQAFGMAQIFAEVIWPGEAPIRDSMSVVVADETSEPVNMERSGAINTTSSYALEGSFTITKDEEGILITFADDYEASTALPGLYVYLTNNPSTNSGAYEIGAVETFSGSHEYRIDDVELFEYDFLLYFCKPFGVKVGDGEIN